MYTIFVFFLTSITVMSGEPSAQKTGTESQRRKPNIIYILADDMGKYELGCYGQDKIKTPNIDKIATEGILFTQHYSGAPVCAPARCTLMTGKHLGHAYIRDNKEYKPEGQEPLPSDTVTLAKVLKENGYVTGAFGKWGLGPVGSSGDPNNQGFMEFYGYNCQRLAHSYYPEYLWKNREKVILDRNKSREHGEQYAHDLTAEAALQFVRDNKERPFFMFVPFIIPHVPLQVPEDSLKEYTSLGWDDPPYTGNRGYFPHKHPRAAYAAMITRMDRQIGDLLKLLKELNLDDDTVVFFSSDNGATHDAGGVDTKFFKSEGILRGRKGSLYEGGITAPLVVRWPGKIKAGSTTDELSAFYDMLPTLADISESSLPAGVTDGVSLLPTLLGNPEKQKHHDFLLWEFYGYGGQEAVRMGDWKAVRFNLHKNRNAPMELYNLRTDPSEKHNVAAKHPEIVEKVLEILKREHSSSELWHFRSEIKAVKQSPKNRN